MELTILLDNNQLIYSSTQIFTGEYKKDELLEAARSGNEDKLMSLLTPLNVNCHASDGRKVGGHPLKTPAYVSCYLSWFAFDNYLWVNWKLIWWLVLSSVCDRLGSTELADNSSMFQLSVNVSA